MSSLAAYLSICTLTFPRPPVISGSPDVVTALIDKNTVAHNGMVHELVSIFLPSLQNITSVSVCWDGPNQFNAKQHSFQISSNGPSLIRGLAGSLRLNSPFIWLGIRTQFSLLMISSRHCLISSSTNTLFRPRRGLSLHVIRPSLIYRATIPLAMERFTPNVSVTDK